MTRYRVNVGVTFLIDDEDEDNVREAALLLAELEYGKALSEDAWTDVEEED